MRFIKRSGAAAAASLLVLGCVQPGPTGQAGNTGVSASAVHQASGKGQPCRSVQALMAEDLWGAYAQLGVPGDVRVQLTLADGQVTRVEYLSGPAAYAPYIARAVGKLHCPQPGSAEPIVVPMVFSFREAH